MVHVRSQRSPTAGRSSLFPPRHPRLSSPNQRQPSPRVAKAPLRFQRLAHSSAGTEIPTSLFSFASPFFATRAKTNQRVFSHFRTVSALFCTRAKINSFVLMRVRTLWKSHRGGGGGRLLQFSRVWALLGAREETGVGCTCSPRKQRMGCTCSPRKQRMGCTCSPRKQRMGCTCSQLQ